MQSSPNYNPSVFKPGTSQPTSSPTSPPTSGQRVPTPAVQSNAPNIPGGDTDADGIDSDLADVLKKLSKDLKKTGKDFVDSLKLYTKDINQARGELDGGGGGGGGGKKKNKDEPYKGYEEDAKFGRGVKSTAMGLGRRLMGAPGGDLQGFLGLAPGFARGAEGFSIAEGLGRQAAGGELAALQASNLLRGSSFEGVGGGSGINGIRSALGGGTLLEEFTRVGMGRGAAANIIQGIASSAGATVKGSRLGGFSQSGLVNAMAAGENVPGYFSNIGGFQSQLGEDARGDLALEFNRDLEARGVQRTTLQAQRQSGFMSLYTQNIGADRRSYNALIDTMGGGSLNRGQAIFQRGAGAVKSATAGLTSDFSGVGASMLQADAMRRAGGDRLKALELLEADQAQGGAAMFKRLKGMGMRGSTARLTLAGMGLSTRDIQTLTTAGGEAGEDLELDQFGDEPMIAQYSLGGEDTLRPRMERALPMSRMFAENENKKVNLGLSSKGLIQQKLNADLQISGILINRSAALSGSLQTLIQTVKTTVTAIDSMNNATRGSFVDSMRAVEDPATTTLDRIYHYGKMATITLLNQKVGL
jgi:hypothetical protein